MSTILIVILAAAAQAPASSAPAVPPLPGQRDLHRILFEDIGRSIASGHAETGITNNWTQGYDVFITGLDCAPHGARATCRFTLTRRPDGTPMARNAGRAQYPLGCRAELQYGRGEDGTEAWRVRTWPGPAGTAVRSTMRCDRDRGASRQDTAMTSNAALRA